MARALELDGKNENEVRLRQRTFVRERRRVKDILVPVAEVFKGDRVLENEDAVGRK